MDVSIMLTDVPGDTPAEVAANAYRLLHRATHEEFITAQVWKRKPEPVVGWSSTRWTYEAEPSEVIPASKAVAYGGRKRGNVNPPASSLPDSKAKP